MPKYDDFSVYRPKNDDYAPALPPPQKAVEHGVTVGGNSCDADNPAAYAKKSVKGDRTTYYVRIGTIGAENGQFFNPWSQMHAGTTAVANATNNRLGQRRFEWKKVPKECYETYVRFLRVKNATHLRQAERMYNAQG